MTKHYHKLLTSVGEAREQAADRPESAKRIARRTAPQPEPMQHRRPVRKLVVWCEKHIPQAPDRIMLARGGRNRAEGDIGPVLDTGLSFDPRCNLTY